MPCSVSQLQWLPLLLEEVHQLVNLKQRHVDVHQRREVPIDPHGCGRYDIGDTPEACEPLSVGCKAVVALCMPPQSNTEQFVCLTLLHELEHSGKISHLRRGRVNDFIYAMECCLCKAMYGAAHSACALSCSQMKQPRVPDPVVRR